jgi:hypothetical protein
MLTSDFMKIKEEELSKKALIKLSGLIGGIGLVMLIRVLRQNPED